VQIARGIRWAQQEHVALLLYRVLKGRERTLMKFRNATLAIAGCLLSSLAFADNPTDAPLMPNNSIAVMQTSDRPNCKQKRAIKKNGAILESNHASPSKSARKMKPASSAM